MALQVKIEVLEKNKKEFYKFFYSYLNDKDGTDCKVTLELEDYWKTTESKKRISEFFEVGSKYFFTILDGFEILKSYRAVITKANINQGDFIISFYRTTPTDYQSEEELFETKKKYRFFVDI